MGGIFITVLIVIVAIGMFPLALSKTDPTEKTKQGNRMKNIIMLVMLVCVCFNSYSEYNNIYGSFNTGIILNKPLLTLDNGIEYKTFNGLTVSGAIGKYTKQYAFEVELSKSTSSFEYKREYLYHQNGTINMNQLSVMFNGLYYFPNDTIITPFIYGGVGVNQILINDSLQQITIYTSGIMIQGGGGFDITISDLISLDISLGYQRSFNKEVDYYSTKFNGNQSITVTIGINGWF